MPIIGDGLYFRIVHTQIGLEVTNARKQLENRVEKLPPEQRILLAHPKTVANLSHYVLSGGKGSIEQLRSHLDQGTYGNILDLALLVDKGNDSPIATAYALAHEHHFSMLPPNTYVGTSRTIVNIREEVLELGAKIIREYNRLFEQVESNSQVPIITEDNADEFLDGVPDWGVSVPLFETVSGLHYHWAIGKNPTKPTGQLEVIDFTYETPLRFDELDELKIREDLVTSYGEKDSAIGMTTHRPFSATGMFSFI